MEEPGDATILDNPKKRAMISALEASLGVVTTAVKSVGIHRSTHYRWMDSSDEFYDANYAKLVKELDNVGLDFAESKLFERINGVKVKETKVFQHRGKLITKEVTKYYPPDPASINFYLATKGKGRGYVKRMETEDVGDPKALEYIIVRNRDDIPKEED